MTTTLEQKATSPLALLCLKENGYAQLYFYGYGTYCSVQSKELQCPYLDTSKMLPVDFKEHYRCNYKPTRE